MEKSTPEDLRLVLGAARQHFRNDQHWKPVSGPAYFESNLGKAENRNKLGEAIHRLEEKLIGVGKADKLCELKRWKLMPGNSEMIRPDSEGEFVRWDDLKKWLNNKK